MKAVSLAQAVRCSEEKFFTVHPDIDLMARAAAAVSEFASQLLPPCRKVLVVVGPGNNGGDGLFAAANLARNQVEVRLWLVQQEVHQAGLAAATKAGAIPVSAAEAQAELAAAPLVIDAYVGIGARAGLPKEVGLFAEQCRSKAVKVLAVDLPSGLVADSAQLTDCFFAELTVTFAALKHCQVLQPAASACGVVHSVDIGIEPPEVDLWQVESADIGRWWPVPGPQSDKYSRGVLRLDTGSLRYPGAAVLGALGATHMGVGLLRYVGPAQEQVLNACPSVVSVDGRSQAQVIGSGWGNGDLTRMAKAMSLGIPTVFDADALAILPDQLPKNSLLTPHAGELAKMLNISREQVTAQPLIRVREAAARWECCVLLKGATQYLACPDGQVLLAPPGPAWTAQGGSGDLLAGVAGGLLAAGLSPDRAAILAAGIQALNAAQHLGPYPPNIVVSWLPETIAKLVSQNIS